jgi:hypothetical protein
MSLRHGADAVRDTLWSVCDHGNHYSHWLLHEVGAQREIKNATQITLKNGHQASQGTCPVCGTKVFKIDVRKVTHQVNPLTLR